MAKNPKKAVKGYTIKITTNPDFCGIGAGGVQFAYGKATIAEGSTIVHWFREHEGYEVTEIAGATEENQEGAEV